jgi:hypothetical protein
LRSLSWLLLAVLVVFVSACGGGSGSSPEDEVKDTVTEFLEAAIDGENGRACAMTTDVNECLSGLVLAEGFLGEGGLEAVLGDDWREQIENAEVTFHRRQPRLPSADHTR